MPKNVQMPDGSLVEFPDSMSDDAISGVLKQQHPAAAPVAEKSLWQTAKDNFNANTQHVPTTGLKSIIQNVGAGGADMLRSVKHLVDGSPSEPPRTAMDIANEGGQTIHSFLNDPTAYLASQAGQAGTGLLLGEALPKVAGAAKSAARTVAEDVPNAYRTAKSSAIGGSKLDQIITGDTVTPRQRYDIAKSQGVNLDTAQATNSGVTRGAKSATEHLMGGSSFEENNAANVEALQVHSDKILNDAHPQSMSREDFGNQARTRLLEDQQSKNTQAGKLYDELDNTIGASKPPVADIKMQAQKIIAENQDYYDKHPEMLKGGAGQAWAIIKNLGKSAEAPKAGIDPFDDGFGPRAAPVVKAPLADSWSDLHKLRSDLMDLTRSPELIGDRPTGWIKQMTSSVDNAMTEGAAGMSGEAVQHWRDANDIYKNMKQTYDNPQSPLYHVVRSADGLSAANQLANVKPNVVRQMGAAAPELIPQLQRQTIDRLLRPTGNDVPDLKNLAARFGRAQKEQLGGVLTPEQINSVENLGRTSRLVNFDSNPPGSGKTMIKHGELSGVISGLGVSATGLATGSPALAVGGLSPLAASLSAKAIAGKLTNPAFTESIMNPKISGSAKWIEQGASKLATAGFSESEIESLRQTAKGKSILMRASSLKPDSAAMESLIKQAK
jgi:hypothetical protein